MAVRVEDLNFMVTLRCPGACLNCNLWRDSEAQNKNDEVHLGLLENALKSEALSDSFYFDLTGGESQLSPRYSEVVRLICQHHPGAFIHTNSSGWYPEIHEKVVTECLKYADAKKFRVDISLDGRPGNYRKLRFKASGWEKAHRTIDSLKTLGIIVRITFIVHKQNYQDIGWIADYANKMGVDYYIGYSRQGNLLKNLGRTDMSFTTDELDAIESMLQPIWLTDPRRRSHWFWAKNVYLSKDVYFDCYMGCRALVIDPYGNVFPCNELLPQLKMGNLREFEGNLDLLLASSRAAEVLEQVAGRRCQPCRMLCAHKAIFPWGNHTGMC